MSGSDCTIRERFTKPKETFVSRSPRFSISFCSRSSNFSFCFFMNTEIKVIAGDQVTRVLIAKDQTISDIKASVFPVSQGASIIAVFNGRVLDDTETAESCGLRQDSILRLVVRSRSFSVRVISDAREFEIPAQHDMRTQELKEKIASEIEAPADEIVLVHGGKVIDGEKSLSFWGVHANSPIRVVKRSAQSSPKVKPAQLIDSLYDLVSQFLVATHAGQDSIRGEIMNILSSPVLQWYSRISRDAKMLCDDALKIIEVTESPDVAKLDNVVAVLNDLTITQFEESAEGMRVLEEVFLSDKTEEKAKGWLPVRLGYKSELSEEPLPTWWSSSMPRELPMEQDTTMFMQRRYRREIRTLKKLGFNDENVILRALSQTSGNLQQAARMLVRTSPH